MALSDTLLMTRNSSKENQQKETFLKYASAHQQGQGEPTKILNNALYSPYFY